MAIPCYCARPILEESKSIVNILITKLEQIKDQFNENIKSKNKLAKTLQEINTNLATLEISVYKVDYIKQFNAVVVKTFTDILFFRT